MSIALNGVENTEGKNMNSLIHLTDFSLQAGVDYKEKDILKYGLNGWRLYNQSALVKIQEDPEKPEQGSVLRFGSSGSEGPLRPGIIMYKVISGFPPGYKLKFAMTARRQGAYNQPRLSFHYNGTILKTGFHLKDDYDHYFGEFTVRDDVTILAIENSITETSGNDFFISKLEIRPQGVGEISDEG
ncbi:hypothetical protein N5K35_12280 [Pseudomonas sp. GD03651]|uniref:Uncharacterized protein n=1 Tax=Pseudomonas fortuita TaxID=3233375 RepID=A0ACD4P5C0_9PSED|nr:MULTISPECIES: hypothetical protein [Pseudomonas]MDH2184490.1 hypothetical protein [Pseudomonas sp. GD03651]WAP63351.1 hypothetical protein OZ911_26290 [Pseudomonas putida]HDS1810747.1 hypothetical protein [Pseudomonas putida]HDS3811354.1 hypothetical protein [Pseudomonas putida]